MSYKKGDLEAHITPRDMKDLNYVVGKLSEKSFMLRKSFVVRAMLRLFLGRYVKFEPGKPPEWLVNEEDAIREILEVSGEGRS